MVNVKGRERRGPQKAGTGFVYRARSAETVKKRAEQKGGKFDSIFKSNVDTWRPKAGVNRIRILPPTWEDFDHYGYQIYVHKYVGTDNATYLCPSKMLNKKCPICRIAKETRDAGEEEEAKKLQATNQFAYYVIDREAKGSPKPEIYAVSWTMDRDIAKLTIDSRTGKILLIDHPDEGFDLTFERDGLGLKTRYSGYRIDREASPISEDEAEQEEILQNISENPISEMLNFYPADYLQNVMDGTGGAKDEDLDEEEVTTKAKANGKRRVVEEDDEEEVTTVKSKRKVVEEDADDEEEDEPAPKSKAKLKAKAKPEPEDDEDDEEDEPPPKKARSKRSEPEDEPDDEEEASDGEEGEESEEDQDEDSVEDDAEEDQEDEEEEKPRRKVAGKRPVARRR